jgi:hypothetical protein
VEILAASPHQPKALMTHGHHPQTSAAADGHPPLQTTNHPFKTPKNRPFRAKNAGPEQGAPQWEHVPTGR